MDGRTMDGIARILSGLVLLSSLSACNPQIELNDQTFARYIRAMQNIQHTYPDISHKLQTEGSLSLQPRDVEKLEDAVKDAGFNDLREFVEVNTAVAWSITRLKGQETVQHQQLNLKKGLEQLNEDLGHLKPQSTSCWGEFTKQFTQPADKKGVDVVQKNLQKLKDIFS